MSEPPQPDQPEKSSDYEMDYRRENPALNQLAQPRNEKTHERCDDITGGSLTHNVRKLGRLFGLNHSVRLDYHKRPLAIARHSDHDRSVRIQSTDNALKTVHIGDGLSINLFDDISRFELLRNRRAWIDACDNYPVHVGRDICLAPKPRR